MEQQMIEHADIEASLKLQAVELSQELIGLNYERTRLQETISALHIKEAKNEEVCSQYANVMLCGISMNAERRPGARGIKEAPTEQEGR
jgi:hypothetical protein